LIASLHEQCTKGTICPSLGAKLKATALGGDVIGKDQCQKLQDFIMSMETAKDLGGLFTLTTAR
jgi:hypothetical protein